VLYILRPDIEEEQYAQKISRFEELIGQEGGKVEGIDEWGKRRLAYEVDHFDQGYYVLMNFTFDPAQLGQVEERFKLDEAVLRHQIVRLDKEG
ncbi:MAG: 30S ribosomal protein S6, partial [Thermoplasmata archaeon]|nr:30S ribosomal protein S6 [Thermoplasmata archaeon]NIY02143.1 30S ribosomal protein S6 [Thermoplasmata archaeon]